MLVQPAEISDRPLEGEEISVEVQRLQTVRARGPLGMRSEHLEVFLRKATQEKYPDMRR